MRAFKFVISILSSLVLLTVLAPPAQAAPAPAPAPIPLTCGMTVRHDAVIYLAKDLTCPYFGVLVQAVPGAEDSPHVLVDLRGHTLRGTGQVGTYGLAALAPFPEFASYLQVINGRLTNWGTAVLGDHDVRTKNVTLVENRVGFGCFATCVADRTYFKNNTVGYSEGEAPSGVITHSKFVGNDVGAEVTFFWSLSIDHSVFRKNDVGVLATDNKPTISRSLFIKNQTAVRVVDRDLEGSCATLQRVRFVRNHVNLDGERCPA